MDYDEKSVDVSASDNDLLRQVAEQSEDCDVTIRVTTQVHTWERMFHRKVLEASPFFARMFAHDWIEEITGLVNIKIGTPETVEMVLMYLYGQAPRIDACNVKRLLDLSEFFLIPGLKAAIVNWLKRREITDNVAFELLHISSFYNILLPHLNSYIESNLNTLFHNPSMLVMSDETVKYFLSNRKFSYVSMNDKFYFLLKWTEERGMHKLQYAKKMLKYIDFSEVSIQSLSELPTKVFQLLKLDELFANRLSDIPQKRDCFIVMTKCLRETDSILCFDVEKKRWFTIKSDAIHQLKQSIYFIDSCSAEKSLIHIHCYAKLYSLNIETDNLTTWRLVSENQDIVPTSVFRYGSQVFAFKNIYLETRISTFYTGVVDNSQEHIELLPLLSLRRHRAKCMCFNSFGTLAILIDEILLLYDTKLHDLTKHSIALDEDMCHMCPFWDGFVVFSTAVCVFVLKDETYHHIFENKYDVIGQTCSYGFSELLRFRGPTCFRCNLFRRCCRCRTRIKLETASFENVINASYDTDVSWTKITLPQSQNFRRNIQESFFVRMSIPADKIRCCLDCPHCKAHKGKRPHHQDSSESDED